MSVIQDMRAASADDREQLFGREFREIAVVSFQATPTMTTVVILEGKEVALIGDPQLALRTYLGGRHKGARQ